MNMKAPSALRAAALLCFWPIVAASAFASHPACPPTATAPPSFRGGASHGIHSTAHRTNLPPAHPHGNTSHRRLHQRSGTSLHLSIPRGGTSAVAAASSKLSQWTSTPSGTFNVALTVLGATTAALKLYGKFEKNGVVKDSGDVKEGPYFYQVYASKSFGGGAATAMTWVSRLFLTGFASTALFGPLVGRLCDSRGRKAGTLAFALLYSLGASSTKSNLLRVLLLGRVLGGIGTSLLFSAPEAWLVGEAGREGIEDSLGETFGLAYAGDSIVAILAGQMAGAAASSRGPTGPFELSVGFLFMGGLLTSLLWKENVAGGGSSAGDDNEAKPTIRDAVKVVKSDPKIMLVGAIQSLFEAAMYIFVLNWPPAVSRAVGSYFAKFAAEGSSATVGTPYGTVFSCFMACCLLGSTLFGQLSLSTSTGEEGKNRATSTENIAAGMLGIAALAMGSATLSVGSSAPRVFKTLTSLPILSTILSPLGMLCSSLSSFASQPGAILSILMLSLFLFEGCVGFYFPTIGTLRSKYFPDSHRSLVMNLFGIPLNAMVVTVFLSIERLGVQGALGVSTAALAVATACGLKLRGLANGSES